MDPPIKRHNHCLDGALPTPTAARKKARPSHVYDASDREAFELKTLETDVFLRIVAWQEAHKSEGVGTKEELMFRAAFSSRLVAALQASVRLLSFNKDGEFPPDLIDLDGLARLSTLQTSSNLITTWKSFLAWPMTRFFFNSSGRWAGNPGISYEPPPQKVTGVDYTYLLGGRFRYWLLGRPTNPNKGNELKSFLLCESLLRLKKCSLPVSDDFIYMSLRDHAEALSQPDEDITGWSDMVDVVSIQERIDSIVDSILPRRLNFRQALQADHVPTRKSTAVDTRSKGGAVGRFLNDFKKVRSAISELQIASAPKTQPSLPPEPVPPLELDPDPDNDDRDLIAVVDHARPQPSNFRLSFSGVDALYEMRYTPTSGVQTFRVPESMLEPFTLPPNFATMKDLILQPDQPVPGGDVRPVDLIASDQLREEYSSLMVGEPVKATAVPIIEPFKVRVITKGSPYAYYEAQRVQRILTQRMKCCSISACFPALQGPIDLAELNRKFKNCRYFLSGDYKGATDTLRRDISEYAMRAILHRLSLSSPEYAPDQPLGRLLINTLTNHQIDYLKDGQPDFSCQQQRGQLMGSFLSFPILNIINLAVNWFYLEPDDTSVKTLKALPLIVNGDDVLAGSDSPFPDWEHTVSLVGFKKSLGKNYVHDTYFCINSEFYRRVYCEDYGIVIQRLETVPTEVLYATSWRKEDDSREVQRRSKSQFDNSPHHVGFLAHRLCGLCSEPKLALNLFIKFHSKELKKLNRPWFLPVDLGGLGLPCLPGMEETWKNDGLIAAYIKRLIETGKLDRSPIHRIKRTYERVTNTDTLSAEISMKYLEFRDWKLRIVTNPSEEDLGVHGQRPNAGTGDLDFSTWLLSQEERENQIGPYSPAALLALAKKSYEQTDLHPVNLSRGLRALWLPLSHTLTCPTATSSQDEQH